MAVLSTVWTAGSIKYSHTDFWSNCKIVVEIAENKVIFWIDNLETS